MFGHKFNIVTISAVACPQQSFHGVVVDEDLSEKWCQWDFVVVHDFGIIAQQRHRSDDDCVDIIHRNQSCGIPCHLASALGIGW